MEEELGEIEEKVMTSSERKANNTKAKLLALRERIAENPPKTVLGKKWNMLKLEKLENKLDRQMLRVAAENSSQLGQEQEFDKAHDAIAEKGIELSDLELQRDDIERELREVEKQLQGNEEIMPDTLVQSDVDRLNQRRPKGTAPREGSIKKEPLRRPEVSERTEKLTGKKQEFEEKLKTVREKIAAKNKEIDQVHTNYDAEIEKIQMQEKENLALLKTHPIKDFFNGVRGKFKQWGEKFNKWNETRKQKAADDLKEAVARTEGVTTVEVTLRDELRVNKTQEEQREYVENFQKKMDEMKKEQEEKSTGTSKKEEETVEPTEQSDDRDEK